MKKLMNDYYLYLVGKYAKTNQSRELQKQSWANRNEIIVAYL